MAKNREFQVVSDRLRATIEKVARKQRAGAPLRRFFAVLHTGDRFASSSRQSGGSRGDEGEVIDAISFVVSVLLEVFGMIWRFVQFLFGRIPTMLRSRK